MPMRLSARLGFAVVQRDRQRPSRAPTYGKAVTNFGSLLYGSIAHAIVTHGFRPSGVERARRALWQIPRIGVAPRQRILASGSVQLETQEPQITPVSEAPPIPATLKMPWTVPRRSLPGRRGLAGGNMRLVESPIGDIVYFALRLGLSGLVAAAAAICSRFAWQARRDHWPWRLAGAGGALLAAAGALSTYDAIDNVLLRPHEPVILASWLWFILFDLPLPILALLLIAAWRECDRAMAEVSRLSVTDALTGALNRRDFLERAAISIAQAQRSGLPAALIMFDIDHFKAINDGYGHAAGDEVLRNVARALLLAMRPGDLLGRLGGEEFAVLLYDSTVVAGVSIADRLRVDVRTGVTHPAGAGRQVTVSGGVAPAHGAFESETVLSLKLTIADEALYVAKREGRDRIIAAQAADADAGPPVRADVGSGDR